jgi:integrase
LKLTDAAVKSATCPPGRAQLEIVDDACRGLVLVIGQRSKVWQTRFSLAGNRHRMPLGRYPALSLAEARAAASAALLAVAKGHDPRIDDLSGVAAAWAAFWATKKPTLKRGDEDELSWARHIAPIIGDLNLSDLTPVVFDRVQAHWVASGLRAGQVRPLRLLKGWQEWMLSRDLIGKAFIPRRVKTPECQTHAVPPLDLVKDFLRWCETAGTPGIQLALLALTGARKRMILDLKWSEVSGDHLAWLGSRMKAGRDFHQPLSGPAKAWLDKVPRVHPVYAFPARHGRAPLAVDTHRWINVSPLAGFRVHDLRSALATHTQEALGVSLSTVSALLDHSPRSSMGVTAVYLKSGPRLLWAERRAALQAWAALLTAPAGDHAVEDAEPLAVAAE